MEAPLRCSRQGGTGQGGTLHVLCGDRSPASSPASSPTLSRPPLTPAPARSQDFLPLKAAIATSFVPIADLAAVEAAITPK